MSNVNKDIVKQPLVEVYDNIPQIQNIIINESETTNPITQEKLKRVDGKYIIGMIEGEFFKPDGMSRNKRFYPRALWERVLKNPDIKSSFINSNMFGEIGHSQGIVDDFVLRRGEASHFIDELWIDEQGRGMGRAYILNTPVGQFLKTYMGAGCKLKVSTRGAGTFCEGIQHDGYPVIDESTYELYTVDFVIRPGFLETNPQLKESFENICINSNNKTTKQSVQENVTKKGENSMTMDAEAFVKHLQEELKTKNEKINSLEEELKAQREQLTDLNSQLKTSQQIAEDFKPYKELNQSAEEIKEAFEQSKVALEEKEQKITSLQETINKYEEKAGTFEELQEATNLSTKAVLALSKYQKLGAYNDLKELKESASKAVQYLQESKQLKQTAVKALKALKEYTELGTISELKELKETATKIVSHQEKKVKLKEALELSKKFKCSVESASKLIEKFGVQEAEKTLGNLLETQKPNKKVEGKSLLKEEATATINPKATEPAEKYLKKGLLQNLKAADFNKEALGSETSMKLTDVKPINTTVKKLSSEYGAPKVEKPKNVATDNKEITPEQADKAAKAVLNKQ